MAWAAADLHLAATYPGLLLSSSTNGHASSFRAWNGPHCVMRFLAAVSFPAGMLYC